MFTRPAPATNDDDDDDDDSSLIYIASPSHGEPSSPLTIVDMEIIDSPAAITITDFLGAPTIPYNPKKRREIEPDAISGEAFLLQARQK